MHDCGPSRAKPGALKTTTRLAHTTSGRLFISSVPSTLLAASKLVPSVSVAVGPSFAALLTRNDPVAGIHQQASVSPSTDAIASVRTLVKVDTRNHTIEKRAETTFLIARTLRVD